MAKRRPSDAVQFTLESAQRIASVVRSAELSSPQAAPLRFDRYVEGGRVRQVRAATFSGSWPVGSSKVLTFKNAPTATATVQNLSWPITVTTYVNEDCIVGKDGTSWYLVVPKLQAATSVIVTQTASLTLPAGTSASTVVSNVLLSAWLNTNSCAITIGKTLTTSQITVVSGTTAAVVITATATASFLRVRVP